jgi:hemoglobin-like flavoprotein
MSPTETEEITIEVVSEAAEVFRNASDIERKQLQSKVSAILKLANHSKDSVSRLRSTMDEISRESQANGLTPEILESILSE